MEAAPPLLLQLLALPPEVRPQRLLLREVLPRQGRLTLPALRSPPPPLALELLLQRLPLRGFF